MAVGPDGSLWFIQDDFTIQSPMFGTTPDFHLRRILPDGTITTPSLGGVNVGGLGSGIMGVTFARDGWMYFTSGGVPNGTSKIFKASPGDNHVSTVYTSNDFWFGSVSALGPGELAVAATPMYTTSGTFIDRLDVTSGTLTQLLSLGNDFGLGVSAGPDGAIYAIAQPDPLGIADTSALYRVYRIDPDGSTKVVAGDGTPDPGDTAQWGQATDLSLSPEAIAATPHNGLLVTSGHVVYRITDPANA